MAYVITNTGYNVISDNSKMLLNCMRDCKKITKPKLSDIYDANVISQRIEQSAIAKQQLDADIFERENRILKSAEARKNLK